MRTDSHLVVVRGVHQIWQELSRRSPSASDAPRGPRDWLSGRHGEGLSNTYSKLNDCSTIMPTKT